MEVDDNLKNLGHSFFQFLSCVLEKPQKNLIKVSSPFEKNPRDIFLLVSISCMAKGTGM